MLLGVLAAAMFGVSANDAVAQNFENTGAGTYNATCGAIIRLKTPTTTTPAVQAAIIGGTDRMGDPTAPTPKAIPGIVEWSSTSAQTVQPYYYQRLVLSGAGAKTVPNGVFVAGTQCPTNLYGSDPNYALLPNYPYVVAGGTGTVTYGGTFNYVGTENQNIFPQTTYATLNITGAGNANVLAGDNVTADVIISAADAPITVAGNLTIDGTAVGGNSDINGNLTINSTGTFTLAAGSTMNIAGIFTNESTTGTNLNFDCSSTVEYDGGTQTIMPTVASKPYGNLVLSGTGLKTGGTMATYPAGEQSNIGICNNFSLAGGNLNMGSAATSGSLIMNAPAGTVTYAAMEEVVGRMQRTITTAGNYTYNNSNTTLQVATAPAAGSYLAMDVLPGTNPASYVANSDVNRKVTIDYNNTGWKAKFQIGYLNSELPGTWGADLSENKLKFYEAEGTSSEKLAGEGGYTRLAAVGGGTPSFGNIAMGGIIGGSDAVDATMENIIKTGNDLVLRSNSKMNNIADGRWTNPNSWDEGRIPTKDDDVELLYTAYVGIDGPFINTPGGTDNTPENNTKSEFAEYGTASAANTITIAAKPTGSNPALIIGNEDNGATYVFKTEKASGNTIVNNNATIPTTGLAAFSITGPGARTGIDAKASYVAANPGFSGIWVTPWGANPAVLQTQQIQNNAGVVNNEGIIEVGQ